MDFEEYIAERIIQLRLKKGVSANDMSISIGQNRNYVNRIENRRHLPSIPGLFYICEYFQISFAEFFIEKELQSTLLSETIALIKTLDENSIAIINSIIKNLGRAETKGA
jgi:transcriptional regulator with XRE-family HTH domain